MVQSKKRRVLVRLREARSPVLTIIESSHIIQFIFVAVFQFYGKADKEGWFNIGSLEEKHVTKVKWRFTNGYSVGALME